MADRAFRELERTWEENARTDPLWSILALPDKEAAWDPDAFFATGESDVRGLIEYLESEGIVGHGRRALDFGCGVGRLTQALASRFELVDGVDVSERMIALARSHDRSGGRCVFTANPAPDLRLFGDGAFDLVLSLLVLQHVPPPFAESYVAEFARVSAPGGAVLFQVPDHRRVPDRPQWRKTLGRLVPRRKRVRLDMYGLPRERVIAALERSGCRVVEVRPDVWAGDDWESYTYLARKG